jgi:hypothetical protein
LFRPSTSFGDGEQQDVDARNKCGHDERLNPPHLDFRLARRRDHGFVGGSDMRGFALGL